MGRLQRQQRACGPTGATILLILLVVVESYTLALPNNFQSDCFEHPDVFLTISSIAQQKKGVLRDRIVEVNWNNLEPEDGDWVGLFDHDPRGSGLGINDPLFKTNVSLSRGYIKTDYRVDRYPVSVNDRQCVGYWIAYVHNEQPSVTNCLSIYPKWMQQYKNFIGDIPLHSLMIPGTHNSGSWHEYEGTLDVFQRYLINQDETVYRQLIHGIRYLDIRIGYYPTSPERYWINHNFYRMRPLSSLVSDVKKFAQETNDIVILDFHRFPVGFSGNVAEERHLQLAEYLNSELGQYLAPSSLWPNATPNDVWTANKSIIISYSDPKTALQYQYLWPPLPQEWGDKRNLPELKGFLKESLVRRGGKGQLWAAMAEFTPKPLDIVLRPTQGLRNMAQTVNIPMTYWFQDKSWYTKANIIATDFFLGTNIVQSSIIANFKGSKCSI